MKVVASEVTAQQFRLFRPGGKSLLGIIIKLAKNSSWRKETYPLGKGCSIHNMIDERSKIENWTMTVIQKYNGQL
jgi:hypothetical protein